MMAERFITETIVIYDCGHVRKIDISPPTPVSVVDKLSKSCSKSTCPNCQIPYMKYSKSDDSFKGFLFIVAILAFCFLFGFLVS